MGWRRWNGRALPGVWPIRDSRLRSITGRPPPGGDGRAPGRRVLPASPGSPFIAAGIAGHGSKSLGHSRRRTGCPGCRTPVGVHGPGWEEPLIDGGGHCGAAQGMAPSGSSGRWISRSRFAGSAPKKTGRRSERRASPRRAGRADPHGSGGPRGRQRQPFVDDRAASWVSCRAGWPTSRGPVAKRARGATRASTKCWSKEPVLAIGAPASRGTNQWGSWW